VIRKPPRTSATLLACLIAVGLTACGGGSSAHDAATPGGGDPAAPIPADAVARVGSTVISKATLNHEMTATFGGDYFEIIHSPAPRGVVAEPPDYPACHTAVKAVMAHLPANQARPSTKEIAQKCKQLYQALMQQALGILLADQWYVRLDAEQGIAVTKAQVEQALKQLKAERFPKAGEFQTYLAQRHWTVGDERLLLLIDLLSNKVLERIEGAGGERVEAALNAAAAKWTARTNCRTGYVVPRCKQYKASSASSSLPSPAILIEQIAR